MHSSSAMIKQNNCPCVWNDSSFLFFVDQLRSIIYTHISVLNVQFLAADVTNTHTLIINVKETRAERNNQAVWRVSLMKCVSTARAQKSHSLNHFINITESEHKKQTHDESLGDPQTTQAWVRMTFIKQRSGLPQTHSSLVENLLLEL